MEHAVVRGLPQHVLTRLPLMSALRLETILETGEQSRHLRDFQTGCELGFECSLIPKYG